MLDSKLVLLLVRLSDRDLFGLASGVDLGLLRLSVVIAITRRNV